MNKGCEGCHLTTIFCIIKKHKIDYICPCSECIVKSMCRLLTCNIRNEVLEKIDMS
jgi:hypothetical protein